MNGDESKMQSGIIMTTTKNGIDVAVREEYDSGRVYGCYFQCRYGPYKQFRKQLLRSHIPVCSRKELIKYIDDQTKLLSETSETEFQLARFLYQHRFFNFPFPSHSFFWKHYHVLCINDLSVKMIVLKAIESFQTSKS